ncbi:MAG: hypothetical protein V8S81_02635 [Oscillospiraceae bacterium]
MPPDTTVDEWFDFWIENIVGDLAPNTSAIIGSGMSTIFSPSLAKCCLPMSNRCTAKDGFQPNGSGSYAGSTIRQTYIAMGTMFKAAMMNDLIQKHPMDGVALQSRSCALWMISNVLQRMSSRAIAPSRGTRLTSHAYDILKQLYSQVSDSKATGI